MGTMAALSALQYVFLVIVPDCFFSFFFHLGFWSGNFFPIAPFPDHCLLLLFNSYYERAVHYTSVYLS